MLIADLQSASVVRWMLVLCGHGPRASVLITHQDFRSHVLDVVDATQSHGDAELVGDDFDRLGDAGLAASAESVDVGAADLARPRTERERPQHILARANAAVEHHLGL